ncbi:MAG TPA: hypothetical protein VFC46_03205, partial [Humisphaera sp.]|nr:hypothetical protein [Humisphaera sp.]
MPPETNNPTDPLIDDGAKEEWARWEQTFRDAQPVLPEAAIARIESSIRRETDRLAVERSNRAPRRIWLWIAAIIAAGVVVVSVLKYRQSMDRGVPVANPVETVVRIRDQYPL